MKKLRHYLFSSLGAIGVTLALLTPIALLSQPTIEPVPTESKATVISYHTVQPSHERTTQYQQQTLPTAPIMPTVQMRPAETLAKSTVKTAQPEEKVEASQASAITQTEPPTSTTEIISSEATETPDSMMTMLTPLKRVEPRYPSKARRKGIEGEVTLRFWVTTAGKIEDIKIIDATPVGQFEKAAIKAVKQWRYQEGLSQPKAQQITLQFRLK